MKVKELIVFFCALVLSMSAWADFPKKEIDYQQHAEKMKAIQEQEKRAKMRFCASYQKWKAIFPAEEGTPGLDEACAALKNKQPTTQQRMK